MTLDQIISIVGNAGTAAILLFLLQRVMARLDTVTDKLIAIIERQQMIQDSLRQQANAQAYREDQPK